MLLVIDMQDRIATAVSNADLVAANCTTLLRAAHRMHVPVLITEHCPAQIGRTIAALLAEQGSAAIASKTHFAATDEPMLAQHIASCNRPQIVIAGVESHVCVLQTAIALAERGYKPFVVADATGSRGEESRMIALERLRSAQVQIVTTEMVLFEWLEHAERAEFRELLALIK